MEAAGTTLVWLRDDLRIADHAALTAAVDHAARSGTAVGSVVAVYVLDDASEGIRPLGGATRWWLHHALTALADDLAALGIPLLLRLGDPAVIVPELAEVLEVDRVHWTRRYGGPERAVDARIKEMLTSAGFAAHSYPGHLLHEPWTVQTRSGGPYKVFTPFWRELRSRDQDPPLPVPEPLSSIRSARAWLADLGIATGDLAEWGLLPTALDWAGGLRDAWNPTETAAHSLLADFLADRVDDYPRGQDLPAENGTSRLSPYLRFGQISPRQVWDAVHRTALGEGAETYLSEIGWREFCWHLLFHFPDMPHSNLRPQFDAYPWRTAAEAPEEFRAWTQGRTGFGLVDAGQRELWATGHMHNRVRMASASLLVKNLGIHWREGEAWFWDTLVDADAASNPANWQWVAGCGADAAPYFRIFNPERQRERFDPGDVYTRRWVPEYGTDDYPAPIVDLKASRADALAAYAALK
ncbi:deoxyribodipyrimidine photo-lyase [Brevibacterium daeguense]|uniref:Deoxyribodipyrimidine photo-lyase n=1 Tax=Brevibacterium daeguense TaxID=909936 RepID=A0ABP8EHK5_9MICO|nr:deoxyribodipyrimidine photo-lyase [Brevibacterium daeguense]